MEADFSPDGKTVSFVRGNNLFVVDTASGRETQLTKDGAEKFLTARSSGFTKKNFTVAATSAVTGGHPIRRRLRF
jgi:hypothetical protein